MKSSWQFEPRAALNLGFSQPSAPQLSAGLVLDLELQLPGLESVGFLFELMPAFCAHCS